MIVVAGGGQRIRVIDEAGSRGRMNSQVSACLYVWSPFWRGLASSGTLSGRGYLMGWDPWAAACRPYPGLLQYCPVGAVRFEI